MRTQVTIERMPSERPSDLRVTPALPGPVVDILQSERVAP
jgi:hypothetical protein